MSVVSMTGFGRHEGNLGDWTWAVEARSVNGRNLEVRFRGPPGFDSLERQAREAAQSRFSRGQISIAVQARGQPGPRDIRVNHETIRRYLELAESIVASGRASAPTLDGLLALPGVVETMEKEDAESDRAPLETAITRSIVMALDALGGARRDEGGALAVLIRGFLDRIETLVTAAEREADQQPALIKARFERRLAELLGEAANAERIVQEAAVIAVRADVREEIDRLAGHVGAARALVAQDGASGRRLDFLIQEFMREANTLCSKSADGKLTAIGLDLKATIDQLREQVQNVE